MRYVKSQMWSSDFVIGLLIFSLMLVAYYTYTVNLSKQDSSVMNDLISDSKTISSSLLVEGYPSTWTEETVTRIGLTNNDQIINTNLLIESSKINYNKTKKLLGATNDFFVFFQNKDGKFITFGGDFGLGSTEVDFISSVKMAYYAHQTGDSLMKDFMESVGADIYTDYTKGPDENPRPKLGELLDNIDAYTLILMEDCHCDKDRKDKDGGPIYFALQRIEDWTSNGGLAFLSEHHNNQFPNTVMGVDVDKGGKLKNGYTGIATVISTDSLLNLELDEDITFLEDVITLEDNPGSEDAIDFTVIAEWTETKDASDLGKGTIARWGFGQGTVYYFPDYHANFLDGDFTTAVEEAIQSKIYQDGFIQINEEYEELIKIERLAIYNSELVKMVVYVWQ